MVVHKVALPSQYLYKSETSRLVQVVHKVALLSSSDQEKPRFAENLHWVNIALLRESKSDKRNCDL